MNPTDRNPPSPPSGAQRAPAGFLRALGAVFSSFLGIRKRASGEHDIVTIKPIHVIVAGVFGAAILVAMLVVLVTMITRKA